MANPEYTNINQIISAGGAEAIANDAANMAYDAGFTLQEAAQYGTKVVQKYIEGERVPNVESDESTDEILNKYR